MNAQEIIGEQEENDWILNPKSHAKSLPDEANDLKAILNSSRVKVLQKRYERHNLKAIESQKMYLGQSKRRIFSAAGGIIFGAYILYSQGGKSSIDSELTWLLSGIEMLLIAAATYYTFILKNSSSYEDWMDERAQAENIRIKYFSEVTKAHKSGDAKLATLQLEYFRRYMLDVQMNYYDGRGKQHKQHAKKFMTISGGLMALAAVTAAITTKLDPATGIDTTETITLLVFIGAVIAALNTMQSQLSMLGEDQRNARRYEAIYCQLLDLSGELDTIREAVDKNDYLILNDFVDRTNEVISLENQEWQTRQKRKPKLDSSK